MGTGSVAAEAFFDHFGLDPGLEGDELLYRFAGEFASIPWENLTKFLMVREDGEIRPRIPGTVILEHIATGSGGTCFSLTETAREILSASGVVTRPVMADMRHGPSIHCAALAEMPGGRLFLIDPGYLVPEPVPLVEDRETVVTCGAETMVYRPVQGTGAWDMFTSDGTGSTWRYRIRLDPVSPREFEKHWLASFHAPGMNSLHISRRSGGTRFYAHNGNLRVTESGSRRNEKLDHGYGSAVSRLFGISGELAGRAWEELKRSRCREQ
jgi:arylamine N-acetyltransferase